MLTKSKNYLWQENMLLSFPKRSGFGPKSDHCSPETSVKKTCYFHFRRDQVLDRNRITVALRRLSRKHVTFKKRSGFEPKSDHCSPETSVKKTCYFHIWRDQILPNWDPLILTGFWRQKVSKSVSREANFRHWYLWHGAELKNLFVGTLIG